MSTYRGQSERVALGDDSDNDNELLYYLKITAAENIVMSFFG